MSSVVMVHQQRDLDAAFQRAGADRLVVLYFTATWCGPCKAIAPRIDAMSAEYKQVIFAKCDIDQNRPLAQSYRISAVPTLVFLKNRQTLETVKGANPSAIEAAVRKHAGAPQKNYVEQGAAPVDKALQGHSSLLAQIDASQTSCLNEAADHGLRDMLASDKAYLESDADEQLLLGISFLQALKVFALRFTTAESALDNAPKTVRIFADQSSLGFDEAASQTPLQEFELTKDQASGKELVLLRYVKFQKANSLQIFIVDNQDGSDVTRIDKLDIFGSVEGATAPLTGLRSQEE